MPAVLVVVAALDAQHPDHDLAQREMARRLDAGRATGQQAYPVTTPLENSQDDAGQSPAAQWAAVDAAADVLAAHLVVWQLAVLHRASTDRPTAPAAGTSLLRWWDSAAAGAAIHAALQRAGKHNPADDPRGQARRMLAGWADRATWSESTALQSELHFTVAHLDDAARAGIAAECRAALAELPPDRVWAQFLDRYLATALARQRPAHEIAWRGTPAPGGDLSLPAWLPDPARSHSGPAPDTDAPAQDAAGQTQAERDDADEVERDEAGKASGDAAASAPAEPDVADAAAEVGSVRADGPNAAPVAARPFRPHDQQDLAPAGELGKLRANLAALRTLRQLQAAARPATPEEQQVLARWAGWGAVPAVFDEHPSQQQDHRNREIAEARDELLGMLSEQEYRAARRTVLFAHYTDAAIVSEVWRAVEGLGFTGGTVLEPGCGSGNFIGLAPDAAWMVGVEQEPVSAEIAAALYPHADVRAESFTDTRLRRDSVDLVVGNVPFADITPTDRLHNPGGHRLHNYFIYKSLALTRPGGVVAALTSRYTLDGVNPAARRDIAELADLVGAVRLPAGAHRRAAGTDVVTDLLLLRRRDPDTAPCGPRWEQSRTAPELLGDDAVRVNEYFLEHPSHVLGTLQVSHSQYRDHDLTVRPDPDADLAAALRQALDGIVATAGDTGLVFSPGTVVPAEAGHAGVDAARTAAPETGPNPRRWQEGYLQAHPDGTFTRVVDGEPVPHPMPKDRKPRSELALLLRLRDQVLDLLDAEAADRSDTPELDAQRAQLNQLYDTYVARYGALNRFSWARTGRVDEETGEEKLRKNLPKLGGFRSDPYAPAVFALEHFNSVTQTAMKADIFTHRVVAPREMARGADTPAEALSICVDAYHQVRLDEIARLLGIEVSQTRDALGTLVFDDPASDALIPAPDYLSGNVRAKLARATQAATEDRRFEANVDALREVLPKDLEPEEIRVQLGAVWVDAAYVQQFLRETLEDAGLAVESARGAPWSVSGTKTGVKATEEWGTERCPAPQIAENLLNQRSLIVRDGIELGGGAKRYVLNLEETAKAQAKGQELNEAFRDWLWADPERAETLARRYNDQFNSWVLRNYDTVELSLPGLALSFEPRSHQVAAVDRMINEPAVGIWHDVGAGKTAVMAMGCMELRRLQMVRKPAIVVPNHMLEQFGREFAQLYPQARILLATKDDLAGDRRRRFTARCATGDWDAVIMTRSAFQRLEMSPEEQERFIQAESEQLRDHLNNAKSALGKDSRTVKQMENAVARREEKVKKRLDAVKDPGISFEQLGVDYLVVDEAHDYKNLQTVSAITGAAIEGSQRATDLLMKLEYLRRTRGERVCALATGTPIANSITETHVMQRYLRPDILEEAGVLEFDAWAATFGRVTTSIEMSPDASRFRMHERFSRFVNLPELITMWHLSGDVRTREMLDLPRPALAPREDGERAPEVVTVPASQQVRDYIASLAARTDAIQHKLVEPDQDNMLKVSHDGRSAALDMRLLDHPAGEPTKLDVVADRIVAWWQQHRDDTFTNPDGSPHPVPGGMQLAFCDLGTPKAGWNVYDELKNLVVARGMPANQIRYVHEANNDAKKGELFAACRNGDVALLLGSTSRMGVGTNVQTRLGALHHLDCPWRPCDIEQRDGRILRQGNQYSQVQLLRYVTEGSFDGYTWQAVARKAQTINSLMSGTLDARESPDIGDGALSAQEARALATGQPLLMKHTEASQEVTRLERLERSHDHSQRRLEHTRSSTEKHLETQRDYLRQIEAARADRRETRGEAFALTLDGTRYTQRDNAGRALLAFLQERRPATKDRVHHSLGEIGEVANLPLSLTLVQTPTTAGFAELTVGVPGNTVAVVFHEIDTTSAQGLTQKLENAASRLDRLAATTQDNIDSSIREIDNARDQLGKPFPYANDLREARAQLALIESQLEAAAAEDTEQQRADAETRAEAVEQASGDDQQPGPGHLADTSAAETATPPSTGLDSAAQQYNEPLAAESGAAQPPAGSDAEANTAPPAAAAYDQDRELRRDPTDPSGDNASPTRQPARAPADPDDAAGDERRRLLLLRWTKDGGSVLYGTDRADDIGGLLRAYNQCHRKAAGHWKFSDRIPNGTDDPGAWYIRQSKGHGLTARGCEQLRHSVHALTEAGFAIRLEHGSIGELWRLHALLRLPDDNPHITVGHYDPDTSDPAAALDRAQHLQQRSQGLANRLEPTTERDQRHHTQAAAESARTDVGADGGDTAERAELDRAASTPQTSAEEEAPTLDHLRAALDRADLDAERAATAQTELDDAERLSRLASLTNAAADDPHRFRFIIPGPVQRTLSDDEVAHSPPSTPGAAPDPAPEPGQAPHPAPESGTGLSLSRVRELAAEHALEARVVRVQGASHIAIIEPAAPLAPLASFQPGETSLVTATGDTVNVTGLRNWLWSYRYHVPADLCGVDTAVPEWARRTAQLVLHTVPGRDFDRGVAGNLATAARMARHGQRDDEAASWLARAEQEAPPLRPTPARCAQLLAAVTDHAPIYAQAGDPARYLAEDSRFGISRREQDWITTWLGEHPDVLAAPPTTAADRDQRDRDSMQADEASARGAEAYRAGEVATALAWLDDAELLDPTRATYWQRLRSGIVGRGPAPPADADAGAERTERAAGAAQPRQEPRSATGDEAQPGPQQEGSADPAADDDADHGLPTVSGVDEHHPVDPRQWGWAAGDDQPNEFGGYVQEWRRGQWRLAITDDADGLLLAETYILDEGLGEDADWDVHLVHDREQLETLLAEGGLHGYALPARRPGLWRVHATVSVADAVAAAEGEPIGGAVAAPRPDLAESGPETRPQTGDVTDLDLAYALGHLATWQFADLLRAEGPVSGRLNDYGHLLTRRAHEHEPGASEQVSCSSSGLSIEVTSDSVHRVGTRTWAAVRAWLDAGDAIATATDTLLAADRASRGFHVRSDLFDELGQADLADAARRELDTYARDAAHELLTTVRSLRESGATPTRTPGPPAGEDEAALFTPEPPRPGPGEQATLNRIAALRATLPTSLDGRELAVRSLADLLAARATAGADESCPDRAQACLDRSRRLAAEADSRPAHPAADAAAPTGPDVDERGPDVDP